MVLWLPSKSMACHAANNRLQRTVMDRVPSDQSQRANTWVAYRLVPGKRIRAVELIIPSEIQPSEIATYLDDLFHEGATPGKSVRLLAQ